MCRLLTSDQLCLLTGRVGGLGLFLCAALSLVNAACFVEEHKTSGINCPSLYCITKKCAPL